MIVISDQRAVHDRFSVQAREQAGPEAAIVSEVAHGLCDVHGRCQLQESIESARVTVDQPFAVKVEQVAVVATLNRLDWPVHDCRFALGGDGIDAAGLVCGGIVAHGGWFLACES